MNLYDVRIRVTQKTPVQKTWTCWVEITATSPAQAQIQARKTQEEGSNVDVLGMELLERDVEGVQP